MTFIKASLKAFASCMFWGCVICTGIMNIAIGIAGLTGEIDTVE